MRRLVPELFWLLFTTMQAAARSHQDLVLENLLLRHQLAAITRPTRRRPHARLRLRDKLVWILARRFCAGWREHRAFVTPETVVRWHRQGWRLFWRWKSRCRGGRPHLSPEVCDLIVTMSRDVRTIPRRLLARAFAHLPCQLTAPARPRPAAVRRPRRGRHRGP